MERWFVRRVGDCELIPRGYGVAWRSFGSATAVCLPMPFNIIAGFARTVWFAMKQGLGLDPGAKWYRLGRDEAERDWRTARVCLQSDNADAVADAYERGRNDGAHDLSVRLLAYADHQKPQP